MADLKDTNQGNPENVDNAIFGSDDGFFEALDDKVNGAIQDEASLDSVATHPQQADPQVATQRVEGSNKDVDWEKRYKDSTREAQRLASEAKDLQPFVPVLEAMKKDSGLVEHVKDYLVNGGAPAKTVTQELGLGEDFVFDSQEAMKDPDSDSGKVMSAHIDGIVRQRVGQLAQSEQAKAGKARQAREQITKLEAFRKEKGMSNEDFKAFLGKARQHKVSLEDVEFLLNREKAATNTANSTKQDMLKQMKNVRNIPTSASGANSQAAEKSNKDNVFDEIMGLDGELDNLFG